MTSIGPGSSASQRFADRLVASNPGLTTAELLSLVVPERREALKKLLRYVPPRTTGKDFPVEDPRLRRKRDRAVTTPLEADLRRRLAERATIKQPSRPTGPVNTGCGADNPGDPREGGA